MDFGTIRKNLEDGVKYVNSEDVFRDVQLIWQNCSKYNKKGAYVLELMKRVKINFMKFWAEAKLYVEPVRMIKGWAPTIAVLRVSSIFQCFYAFRCYHLTDGRTIN